MDMMMSPGKITISRYSGHKNGISIEIRDGSSGVRFLCVELTPEVFGNVITGLGAQDCQFELHRADLIGTKHEHKCENVQCEGYHFETPEKKRIVAPYEVDGWEADLSDLGNPHRRTQNGFNVRFHRYVKP